MNTDTPFIIVNPASGGGRTEPIMDSLLNSLRSRCGGRVSLVRTERPGHGAELARQAVLDGHREIVVVGGDGTIHECVNGIFALPPSYHHDITLGIVSTGTGCGLGRSLGIPLRIEDQIAIAFDSECRTIDLGRMRFDHTRHTHVFVNECQIGIGAEVVLRTRKEKKAFGGSLSYTLATIPLLFSFPNPEVQLEIDDAPQHAARVTGISIGNGAITAGGMHLTPRAVLDDGLIDVLIMKGQSPVQRARGFAHVRSGKHIYSPNFDYHQVQRIRITSSMELPVTADGELSGALPVTIDTLPKSLRVHVPSLTRRMNHHDTIHHTTEAVRV